MDKVKFDSDVPLPMGKKEIVETYRFADMQVGQSFFAVADTKEADKIAAAAREWGKSQEPPRTFVAERREEVTQTRQDGTTITHKGVRVWRKT
jgi:hypothetical protein